VQIYGTLKNATIRGSFASIGINGSNYAVLSSWIIVLVVFSLSAIGATLVAWQASDQDPSMSPATTKNLIYLDLACIVFIGIAYIGYLRNVGTYVYGRIKPTGA
jgi:hypothetical protein